MWFQCDLSIIWPFFGPFLAFFGLFWSFWAFLRILTLSGPLQGRYALDTWWLLNMMCLWGLVARNSLFGHFVTTFSVDIGLFEGPNRGRGWTIWLDYKHRVSESGVDGNEDVF